MLISSILPHIQNATWAVASPVEVVALREQPKKPVLDVPSSLIEALPVLAEASSVSPSRYLLPEVSLALLAPASLVSLSCFEQVSRFLLPLLPLVLAAAAVQFVARCAVREIRE